jgi:hypothetical protein
MGGMKGPLPNRDAARVVYEEARLAHNSADNKVALHNEAHGYEWRIQRKIEDLKKGYPKAPFVENTSDWVTLSAKRMLQYAAENGYDRITWTTGEQQIKRYESALRSHVDEIHWEKTVDDKGKPVVHLKGYKGGFPDPVKAVQNADGWQPMVGGDFFEPRRTYATQEEAINVAQKHYEATYRKEIFNTKKAESDLSRMLEKPMAKQILEDPSQTGVIKGDNITVDKTWPRRHYDEMVVDVMNKLGKKYGVKVGKSKVPTKSNTPIDLAVVNNGDRYAPMYQVQDAAGGNISPIYTDRGAAIRWMNAYKASNKLEDVHSLDLHPGMKDPHSILAKGFPMASDNKDEKKPSDYFRSKK